ncbi:MULTISPECIES: SHOCT domain-containing protein [unclassified Thermosipho (in: thermotogales)]|uniref:SHOCT domain-containing protein n=1 Tax=unclassified Thermosipho (in: thermotogales) TaxID=2676525 RepID=UPI0009843E06|nr:MULTISPECIES: SHOCT domain-containing protein [unclassified Thermosipho (in: thermotogales)]MBT1247629.1 hypothetical protein [Thermosipho sp. 1244]OOC46136.1 hypothetical protein XO09_06870 [Thermosipho sp. 1223]
MLLLGVLIWYFIKNSDVLKKLGNFQNNSDDAKKKALKILNEKFVNGEITEEEYLRKKKLINEN